MKEQQSPVSLSVIVPCYNVEPYLDQSLQCLEKQWNNRTDYEIIFINDASSDGTILKLNDFKSRHSDNVFVVDKEQNEGVSAARNSGLDIARGEWITFFDPDDALVENGYDHLLALAEKGNFDILRFGVKIIGEGKEIPISNSESLSLDWQGSSVEYLLENSFGTCWSYIFKRELLVNHRFPPLTICEDTVFNLSILLEDKTIARTSEIVYYYINHSSSLTNTVDTARLGRQCDDIFRAIHILEDFKNGQSEDVQSRLKKHQFVFSPNLLTRMLLSDKKLPYIKDTVKTLKHMGLFPLPDTLPGADFMMQIINFVFKHPFLVPLFRPLYRARRCK